MPELPEVEIARRNLQRWLAGARIAAVERVDQARFEGDPQSLLGHVCFGWERRGKVLLGRFSGGVGVLSHLGMTGKWVRDDGGRRAHVRVRLTTDGGPRVALVDVRRFGRTWVGNVDALQRLAQWTRLGPDALMGALDGPLLASRVGPRKTPLKRRLLDQSVVAGLGNIAVVEVCWRASVHPHAPCTDIAPAAWVRLAAAIRAHLDFVLEVEDGDEITYLGERAASNPFVVYGRARQPCPRCAEALVGESLSGRPSVWCPSCQPS